MTEEQENDYSKKLLFIKDVYKSYGSKVVLDNIDLSVSKKEFCSVVGPSGCGKSTLLRLILGEEKPTRGELFIDGKPISEPNPDRGIVYQRYSLYPHLTVLQNVLLGKKLNSSFSAYRSKYKEYEEEALAILETMRLENDGHKYPHELSGGMQQRVAIAQALIMHPKVLLMDEPFGALDPGTRDDMQIYLLEAWEKFAMTIFFVTHDLEEALFLGTRILVLSQYYKDDDSSYGSAAHGARLVIDKALKTQAGSTEIKQSESFKALIAEIRQSGFEPDHSQHISEFNLSHPDSWRSIEV